MIKIGALVLTVLSIALTATAQGRSWVIQLEEPTGIERRDNEVVRFIARFASGQARPQWLRVPPPTIREQPVTIAAR